MTKLYMEVDSNQIQKLKSSILIMVKEILVLMLKIEFYINKKDKQLAKNKL